MLVGVVVLLVLGSVAYKVWIGKGLKISFAEFEIETKQELVWLMLYGSALLVMGFMMNLSLTYILILLWVFILVLIILLSGLLSYESHASDFLNLHEIMMQCAHYYPYSKTLYQTLCEVDNLVASFDMDLVVDGFEVKFQELNELHPHYLWRTLMHTLGFAQESGYQGIAGILQQYERDIEQSLEDMMDFQEKQKKIRKQLLILSFIGCLVGAISFKMMPNMNMGSSLPFIFLSAHFILLVWSWKGIFESWDLKEHGS